MQLECLRNTKFRKANIASVDYDYDQLILIVEEAVEIEVLQYEHCDTVLSNYLIIFQILSVLAHISKGKLSRYTEQ